jgi:SAM-dependent methyltransferase
MQAARKMNPEIDQNKLQAFVGQAVTELGATYNAALVMVGDELGLYKAMAGSGPLTADELATRTSTHTRYIREWLNAQAAGGYVEYDPEIDRYTLPPEHAMVLADETSPVFMPGGFQVALAAAKASHKIAERFQNGFGMGWHEHDQDLFCGCERFFRPGYNAHLVSEWIPALDGVREKLERGAKVADLGCGHGASTILMAKEFPRSRFYGFDYHQESIETARRRAIEAGVADRCVFEVASAQNFPGSNYDLVACFDCLHDMGDPVGASRQVLDALADDGTWLIVEPFAGDSIEENMTPVGRVFYAASTLICTPASRSQEVGLGLGAQAGEARLREVVSEAGFSRFRRATETPFNLVLEARP